MAGWRFLGFRGRHGRAGSRSEGPGAPSIPTAAMAGEWQWSRSSPDTAPTGGQDATGVVIHARRAGDASPVPPPGFAA
jgi:hypothetical protein